jgi:arylsulfatase A-like enzyme
MDWHVGRILDALGEDPNTIILFFSDHGEYLGDYDLIEKWPSGLHDCLARDPLIIAGPGVPEGVDVDSMVELLDIVPTIHEFAGIEADYTHFGRSLIPAMRDPSTPHREYAFTEGGFGLNEADLLERAGFPYDLKAAAEHDRPETVGRAFAVRTQRYTYIWRLYEPAELYDRVDDLDELRNLSGDPALVDVEADLRDAIMRWLAETGDVIPWREDPRAPQVDLPRPLASRAATP